MCTSSDKFICKATTANAIQFGDRWLQALLLTLKAAQQWTSAIFKQMSRRSLYHPRLTSRFRSTTDQEGYLAPGFLGNEPLCWWQSAAWSVWPVPALARAELGELWQRRGMADPILVPTIKFLVPFPPSFKASRYLTTKPKLLCVWRSRYDIQSGMFVGWSAKF